MMPGQPHVTHAEYEYIEIIHTGSSPSGKTHRWAVKNLSTGEALGAIQWFSRWRQYVFLPCCGSVYSAGCLRDITEFIEEAK